ncbi:MAG: RNA polymerase sigma factor (sigma-70 family) [Planctomycetota bacterium]|jgi:RNA polymerase sigma factor (sigma-70 family)
MAHSNEEERDPTATSYHVRGARDGDELSLEWVVSRFSPGLLATARYRIMQGNFLSKTSPEDLVAEVWLIALPSLAGLSPRDGRFTPVVFKFLSSALKNVIRRQAEKNQRRKRIAPGAESSPGSHWNVADGVSDVVSRAVRKELIGTVHSAIDQLGDMDREVLILRGIEQRSLEEVAILIGESTGTVATRFHRALSKLQQLIPGTVFDDIKE